MAIKLSDQHVAGFVNPQELTAIAPQIKLAHEALHSGTGLSLIHIYAKGTDSVQNSDHRNAHICEYSRPHIGHPYSSKYQYNSFYR